MQLVSLLITTLLSASASLASPAGSKLVSRASTPNSYGVSNGFYYRWWTDGQGHSNATYTNGPGGSYTVDWTNSQGDLYGGKGWATSSPTRVAHYEGTFQPNGNAYLSLYGLNKSPYGDYRVLESYGTYNPTDYYPILGQVTCDGATYDVIDIIRYPEGLEPIIHQFYSVRNPKLPNGYVEGSIDLACHLAGWASLGLNVEVDTAYWQVVITEGYSSSGYSNITIS
ncbi:hypothetical protein CVT24_000102 [Panaeolus cyanescens]|uniref:endo-1,4-beta-xylanase n=1 Tax=Panaeolus cyanescens TaxID=181874 RepID=A0A409W7P9_9AGAR|nr:hypothetical protein CVT24_000102 [Panaeolus cyanescens]